MLFVKKLCHFDDVGGICFFLWTTPKVILGCTASTDRTIKIWKIPNYQWHFSYFEVLHLWKYYIYLLNGPNFHIYDMLWVSFHMKRVIMVLDVLQSSKQYANQWVLPCTFLTSDNNTLHFQLYQISQVAFLMHHYSILIWCQIL